VLKKIMKKFTSQRLQNPGRFTGLLKLGLVILAALTVTVARAQFSFAGAQVLPPDTWGFQVNDNTGVTPDPDAPNIAGSAPNAPLWYQWTAPANGEVELDTVGSVDDITGTINLDTVLAVFTGTTLATLNQVAANDDLFPINSLISLEPGSEAYNETGSGDYAKLFGPGSIPIFGYIQPYHGPSHLRFNATAGTTYYIAVDSRIGYNYFGYPTAGSGFIVLNWAYKSSGVFRFATEDVDLSTGLLLYQAAETESAYQVHYVPVGNAVLHTYYNYNAPGALVTVTRVAGSSGRCTVDYKTEDGSTNNLNLPVNDASAYVYYTNIVRFTNSNGSFNHWVTNIVNGDYSPVNGTLVFDDYEMSKTILIPINSSGGYCYNPYIVTNLIGTPSSLLWPRNNLSNTVFGVQLVDDGGVTSPTLDPYESGNVSQPRVDPTFSLALVKILNANADPYGPDTTPVVTTNNNLNPPTYATNWVIIPPTNVIVNFQKCNFRVPEDVNDANNPNGYTTPVTIYVRRFGTNTASLTLNYRVNNFINDQYDPDDNWNNWFPLQPGSDYAINTPPNSTPLRESSNSDFNMVAHGTITFPASPDVDANLQPITFTVTNSTLTKFNRDFKIELYQEVSVNGATVPEPAGMVAETTVTILFNDQHPPAGSVDELYNADFNGDLALAPDVVPVTKPQNDSNPGVSGVVNSLVVLPNNETLIAGDFASYNGNVLEFTGNPIYNIALIDTNGQLDSSFAPNSGANGPINAVAMNSGGQFVIGGAFTSFNGQTRDRIARVNADGSLDGSFNPSGADGTVWATAVQADGKVLIGGDFTHVNGQTRDYLARLNTDGSLDTTFDPANTLSGPVYALALPPSVITSINRNAAGNSNEDDQILNLGNFTSGTLTVSYDMFPVPDDMRIFYGDTNVTAGTGVLIYDTGLVSGTNTLVIPLGPINGVNGLLTTNIITIVMNQGGRTNTTQWKYTASVAPLTSSSGILVGGNFAVSGQNYSDVARFTASGTLDTTFSPTAGANNPVHALGWQFDGKVVVGGSFTYFNGISANHIVRLNVDGSLDTTNFFMGTGANDIVWSVTPRSDGTIYVGGQFSSFNGTHRLGFTRLYANGTLDTTFMDTAYNQFAGLKRIYSDPFPNAAPLDTPTVYACGIQSDGNVMIGGSFDQVGGGQANPNVCNTLDDELGIQESFGDTNLWVEPKTRDGVRNRSSIARLIGGSTPGPGNISLQPPFSANKSQTSISTVGLVRTNGVLGPVSANFSVLPELAKSGVDYYYDSAPPCYWVAWRYTESSQTRLRSDGLFGVNGLPLQDVFSHLTRADDLVNTLANITVSIRNSKQTSGNLNAQFQLANPSGADTFYLGGENIPLGTALGQGGGGVQFTLIDDNKQSGTVGFSSPVYIATNTSAAISLVRTNGTYDTVTMLASTADGTALAGVDYNGITDQKIAFGGGVVTNSFTVTVINSGLTYTSFVEKFLNLHLTSLSGPPDGYATFGLSNAVLRLINPRFPGYLTLSADNYATNQSAGFINFVVNRVAGSKDQISVQYATTNGTALHGVDYIGSTNTLQWNSGDASPRTVNIPLINNGMVGASKQFGVYLFNPTNGLASAPSLFYAGAPPNSITNATLTINNDNSSGVLQFSAPSYIVSENGDHATITVVRTVGTNGTASVVFNTADNTAVAGVNYTATSGTLNFSAGQTAASFDVPILDDGVQNPGLSFNVTLSSPVNAVLGSPTAAAVNILDSETYNWPPGSPDGTFNSGMNGDVLALALQTNGQILAGGNFTAVNGTPENYLARLNPNGSLDSVGFLNGMDGPNGAVQAVVCQTDDSRVIIGGSFTAVDGIYRNYIARLMTDGSLDTSFKPGPGASGPVYSLAETFVSGSREIYVGGAFSTIGGDYSPNFARLNNDGTPDTTFAIGSGPNAPVYAIAAYPTNSVLAGKVLIGGAFTNVNGYALNHVALLNVDGSVDTNFDFRMGARDVVRAIVIQNDGGILIGGDFTNVNGVALNHIARLNADGRLDPDFTTATAGVGANGSVEAIAVQADNRIVLAGQFTQASGVTRNHITRLMSNGAMDPTINFGTGANDAIDALVIQPADQMMVIGGGFTQYDDQPAAHIARIYGGSVTGNGWLQFASASYQVDEKGGQALITIERTGGTSGTDSVDFDTSDGTAVSTGMNYNYTAVHTPVTFLPGEVLRTVVVPVRDDGLVTNDLTVNLALSNPIGAEGITNRPSAVLTIINDDAAVSFSAASYSVDKDVLTGFAPIDVIRLGTTNGTCSVDFITTTNGTATSGVDFYPTNTTITFNPGDTDKQIQVPIINNTIPEGYRTVAFTLTNAVNALLYSPSNAALTIIDTVIAPGQFSFSTTNYTAYVSDGNVLITVVRTNGTSGTVTVAYNTVAGTALPGVNYYTTSGTLTFNPLDTSKTFAVPLVNDNNVQGPLNLSVVLSNPPGGTAMLIAPTNATLTLLHTNVGVAFVNATNFVIETAGTERVFVQRLGDTTASFQVDYFTADGTASNNVNYTGVTNTLDFPSGATLEAISIPLLYDTNVTGDLKFTVCLSNATSGVQLVSPSNTVVVVQDADASLSFTNTAMNVLKDAGNAVITVVCSNPNAEPLSVHYFTADGLPPNGATNGVNYTAVSNTLTFAGGIRTNTFNVPIINNGTVKGDRTFAVNLSNPTPPGQLGQYSLQTVTIVDNEPSLSFSSPTYTVSKNGVSKSITVLRSNYTNTVTTVSFTATNGTAVAGSDYISTNGVLVFDAGQTSNSFSVRVINNTAVQPDKTVLLQLFSPTNGVLAAPYAATLTIHDTSGGTLVVPAGSRLISESGPTNGIIDTNETVTLLFAFRAAAGSDVTNLVATLLATNGIISPSPGLQNYGWLTVGGQSVSRTNKFTVSPGYTNGQQIVATFQLQGNGTNLGTNGFTYTLGTWTRKFYNTNLITINDSTNPPTRATPYPSTIDVSGVGGTIIKATVTLTNLTHNWAHDINALVVSPGGQDTLIMSHAGPNKVNKVTLTFDDDASTNLTNVGTITNGTYKPTAYGSAPNFP
jgi:uncharacterized delta-60 repeat protein